jgi:Flp pilus assembly protein TadD
MHAEPSEQDEGIRFATGALVLRPENPRVWVLLGDLLVWRGRPGEALVALDKAIDLAPNYAQAHNERGNALLTMGRFAEAVVAYRKAVGLQPELPDAHVNLGLSLWKDARQYDEAIVELRRSVTLAAADGGSDIFLMDLGWSLMETGRLNEAIAALQNAVTLDPEATSPAGLLLLIPTGQSDMAITLCRKAIAAQPEDVAAYLGLAWGLYVQGKFAEALPVFGHAQKLVAKRPMALLLPLARWTQEVERMKAIDSQWPDYVSGKVKPQDRVECRLLTLYCVIRKQYRVAARLHMDGLTAHPEWADDLNAEARYDAARFAALAASGQGQDAANLTEGERGLWRKRAVAWLRAELTRWATYLETAAPLDRTICLDRLRWWQQEPDLATVRDPAAVTKLPVDEQEACKKLWADVAALLKKAQEGK